VRELAHACADFLSARRDPALLDSPSTRRYSRRIAKLTHERLKLRNDERDGQAEAQGESWLVCRAGAQLFALRAAEVIETMRPLPLEPVCDAPPFVSGLAVIRGVPVPVVDLATLFGAARSHTARFVTLRIGARTVALAVDAVIGLRAIPAQSLQDLPPLLRDGNGERISALGTLDTELLVLLQSGRLIPERAWDTFGLEGTHQ
jgi:purine-binding chemotaxis protein CheW